MSSPSTPQPPIRPPLHDANATTECDESEPSPAVRSPQQPAAASETRPASLSAAQLRATGMQVRSKDEFMKAMHDLVRALKEHTEGGWGNVIKAIGYIDDLRQPMVTLATIRDLAGLPGMGAKVLDWLRQIVRDGACSYVAHLDAGLHGMGKRQRRS